MIVLSISQAYALAEAAHAHYWRELVADRGERRAHQARYMASRHFAPGSRLWRASQHVGEASELLCLAFAAQREADARATREALSTSANPQPWAAEQEAIVSTMADIAEAIGEHELDAFALAMGRGEPGPDRVIWPVCRGDE